MLLLEKTKTIINNISLSLSLVAIPYKKKTMKGNNMIKQD
jgi:hypothetical protein